MLSRTQQLLADMRNLHKQATIERSHFYVGSVLERAIAEIEKLRRYCSAAAADYAGVLASMESATGSTLADHFLRTAKELRETSKFIKLAAEGREDGTLYDDELSQAKAEISRLTADLDRAREALGQRELELLRKLEAVVIERDRAREALAAARQFINDTGPEAPGAGARATNDMLTRIDAALGAVRGRR